MRLNIEVEFAECVRAAGGQIVDEILPEPRGFKNADYLFRDERVVAELKCLEKDVVKTVEFNDKVLTLCRDWERDGLFRPPGAGPFVLKVHELPEACARSFLELIKKPLESVVKKANRQIRETRDHFGMPEAKGLLLLANDGNLSLELDVVVWLLNRILANQFSCIHSVIYFTANFPASVPNIPMPAMQWLPAIIPKREPVDKALEHRIRDAWFNRHATLLGHPIVTFNMKPSDELLGRTRFIR